MTLIYWIIGLVALQRLGEIALAHSNTRYLLNHGGHEVGAGHYPLFFVVHGGWLATIAFTAPQAPYVSLPLLALFVLLQLARIWVIATLGRYWTTRIITMPTRPLVHRGPYRFCKHPNYVVVTGEIAVLPLAFGLWELAIFWSVANAALLYWRIRIENAALAQRERITASEHA